MYHYMQVTINSKRKSFKLHNIRIFTDHKIELKPFMLHEACILLYFIADVSKTIDQNVKLSYSAHKFLIWLLQVVALFTKRDHNLYLACCPI